MLGNRSVRRHLLHCCTFAAFLFVFECSAGGIRWGEANFERDNLDPIKEYGLPMTLFLYSFRLLIFLPLPLVVCHALGLLLYNVFPEKQAIRGSPLLAPFISIRVVTRGDFPELVQRNVSRNMKTCLDLGKRLENNLIWGRVRKMLSKKMLASIFSFLA